MKKMDELDRLKIKFVDARLQLEIAQSLYKSARNDLVKALDKQKIKVNNESESDT